MISKRSTKEFFALCALFLVSSCSGAQRTETIALTPLAEPRAVEVILEGFQQSGVRAEIRRVVQLPDGRDLEIDVATAGGEHGVEYVHAADRTMYAGALPQQRHADALTCMPAGRDGHIDVLVLDDREFAYEPHPELASAGRPTQFEVEDRLRRAVVDYLTHLRSNGRL